MSSSKRIALILLTALGLAVQATPAAAQIVVQIGPTFRPAPPPPPVVYVRPAPQPPPPPVVYVRPAPPPPPPRVIYVQQPQPQPRVVYVQQPQPQPQPVQVQPVQVQPRQASGRFGIHASVGGLLADNVRMGGISGALRLRPSEHFALDLGAGVYGGTDYNGDERLEVPIMADALIFINPQHRLQLYAVAGVGTSIAATQAFEGAAQFRHVYVGGEGGLGLEWRITRGFALNVDARAFMRARVDSTDPAPEFVDAEGNTTNVSSGGTLNLGATLYF
jgi:hypothetical protein